MSTSFGFDSSTKSDGMLEKLIHVNRNSKVVEGGKKFSFTAYIVVGDGKGRVGLGSGKALEVSAAIQKAMQAARKSLVKIELNGSTLQHRIVSCHGASRVFMQPASKGTGIIAGGAMRAVFEVLGVHDVLAKTMGSSTPINVVRATIKGLQDMRSPRYAADKRGKKISDILPPKEIV
ncbi:MAG TPA: 30S ribosomal protein S5 [Gammaproteobacteria bacterium]|nr:30S ribosomal protein S5 [Gammaproteobacteria bacterium]